MSGETRSSAGKLVGLMARFDSPETLLAAARKTREAGFTRCDAYTPYPVHGVDEALGVPRSLIPRVTLVAGLTGCAAALALQGWTSAIDYKLVIGGKPLFPLPAFVPILFELTVLFAGIATVVAMFHLNRLPTYHSPLAAHAAGLSSTQGGFVLTLPVSDPRFDAAAFETIVRELGAEAIPLHDEETE